MSFVSGHKVKIFSMAMSKHKKDATATLLLAYIGSHAWKMSGKRGMSCVLCT